MKARLALFAIAIVAMLAFAGCGGGGSSDTDPASLAPADAPLYIQGVLRPQGKLKSDTEALASAISGFADPSAELIGQIDKELNNEPTLSGKQLSYAKDIEPWLGEQAGVFVEGFQDDPPAAAIVSTTDVKAAQAFVEDGKQKGDEDRSYKGVDYVFDPDGTAAGVVGDFVVIGNEKAFKDAVDVSDGADALSGQDEFTNAMDWASSGSLADVYLSLDGVARAIRTANPASATTVQAAIGDLSGKAVLVSLTPSSDQAELDLTTDLEGGVTSVDLSALVGTFPADSFAAIATPNLGDRIQKAITQLEDAGVEGVSKEAIDQQLAALGTSLDEITKSLGDLGIFAEGSDKESLQGAAVITTDNPGTAKGLIGNISNLALNSGDRGISRADVGTGLTITSPEQLGPQPLTVTTEGNRIVIGYGAKATEQALSGGGATLSGTSSFKAAVKALGGTSLSGFVALPAVFRLAGSLGANSDPGFQKAKRYLDALTFLAFGSGTDGDLTTSKIVIGVQK
jgi:Protein of unknown function (DUF3352)